MDQAFYQNYKPLLFSIAYRMTGSVMDSEDLVQDTFLTYSQIMSEKDVENEKAYLCKIVVNKSIDLLRSSRRKREQYVGEWLPEPYVEENFGPEFRVYMNESISTAYLLLLQKLSEVERAVFILREVFQFGYEEIGKVVEKSAVNSRQIFHRSKEKLNEKEKCENVDHKNMKNNIEQFTLALQQGNIDKMLQLLKNDAIYIADGGGKATAALRPIYTAERIVQFFMGIIRKLPKNHKVVFKTVNGQPGILLFIEGILSYVFTFEFAGKDIATIFMMVNPEKLRHL